MSSLPGEWLLEGEYEQLQKVAWDAATDSSRKSYAEWLIGRDDCRSQFLLAISDVSQKTILRNWPTIPDGVSREWAELVGFGLLDPIVANGLFKLKESLLPLARPALRIIKSEADDSELKVGASKLGGNPDLPDGVAWPLGKDCRAIYNNDTAGIEKPAGFLFQVNLEEISRSQAARDLPSTGLLSFFSYVNWKNPDYIGAKVIYSPDIRSLTRKTTPEGITHGNRPMVSQRLTFEEFLDIPDLAGPWKEELPDCDEDCMIKIYEPRVERNRHGFLGYAKTYQECDPTPSKDSRHLVMAENVEGMTLHIQIPDQELAQQNFDAITLNWVDFD